MPNFCNICNSIVSSQCNSNGYVICCTCECLCSAIARQLLQGTQLDVLTKRLQDSDIGSEIFIPIYVDSWIFNESIGMRLL